MDKLSSDLLECAVPPLLEWYRVCKRDLPWRRMRNPYTALVAELMLQQTRVEAVKERYVQFLEAFPTPEVLAEASEEEVLKLWEGLGYYSRARNLHRAAKVIAEHGFPQTFEGVRALPGVGDYTAGAVCSIALGLPAPAVDGNVLRVLSRLYADDSNIDDAATKPAYAALLREVYPADTADFCEALMELGAIVCVPNGAPLCGECPWKTLCRAHLSGMEDAYPVRKEKKARRIVEATVCVLKCGEKYALEKRPEKGLLAGLWQFPFFEGNVPDFGKFIAEKHAKHIFTHVEWRMTGKRIDVCEELPPYTWVTAQELREKYAVPSAFKAFLPWIK